MPLRVALGLRGLDLEHPTGIAVYANFVRDLLLASGEVELTGYADAEAILSLDGRFRPGGGQITVTAVYDLGHLLHQRAYSPLAWVRQNWQVASAARRSDHLLAPSVAVRSGLRDLLKVPEQRITLLEPLPRDVFRRTGPDEVRRLREELGLPARYVLFLGTRSRRKNLATLGRAWQLAAGRLGDIRLVLAGPGSGTIAGVLDVGHVALERLPALLSGALAWACPSFYEGCGVGALEAMACGAPPVVAASGALPRTVDRAGLVLDPEDPQQWASAIVDVIERDPLRASLAAAGRKAIAERRAHPPDAGELLEVLRGRSPSGQASESARRRAP
jgi:glycosyltransferase involved in cell wall biosynthesis